MEKKSFKELNDGYKMKKKAKKKANEMQKIYSVSPDQAKKLATLDLMPEKLLQLYNNDDGKFEQELSKRLKVRSKPLRKKLLEWIQENKLRA